MKVLKFEITAQGLYRVGYIDDDLVEITATYDEKPRKDLLCTLARTKGLFIRSMCLENYSPDISDRLAVTGINVKDGKGADHYEIMAELHTPGHDKVRKLVSYPLVPGELLYNELTGEVYRDVDTEAYPCLMDDADVELVESLISGVLGFIRGERDEEQLELMPEGGEDAGA